MIELPYYLIDKIKLLRNQRGIEHSGSTPGQRSCWRSNASRPGPSSTSCAASSTARRQAAEVFIDNVADHAEAFAEVGSQAISYAAGVPAAAATLLIAKRNWDVRTIVNVEELAPRPFLALLDRMGLPTHIKDADGDRPLSYAEERARATRRAEELVPVAWMEPATPCEPGIRLPRNSLAHSKAAGRRWRPEYARS